MTRNGVFKTMDPIEHQFYLSNLDSQIDFYLKAANISTTLVFFNYFSKTFILKFILILYRVILLICQLEKLHSTYLNVY